MPKILTNALIILFLVACSGASPAAKKQDSAQKRAYTETKTEKVDEATILTTPDGLLVKQESRGAMFLYGKDLECAPVDMLRSVQQTLPTLLAQIKNHGAIIAGPMTFVYKTNPKMGKRIHFFLGLPIKSKFKNPELGSFLNISASNYYKMQCDAETGQTFPFHQKLQAFLASKGKKTGLPVLEIFSETRNGDMTMVSKASLLYPILSK